MSTGTGTKKDMTIVVHDVKGPAATIRAKLTTPAEKLKGFGGTLLLDKGEVRRITDRKFGRYKEEQRTSGRSFWKRVSTPQIF